MTQPDAGEQKAVLVTGAGGFLGSHVTAMLRTHGFTVRNLMGPPAEAPLRIEGVSPEDEMWADICDGVAVRRAVSGMDVVVHLAGPPSVAASFSDPTPCVRTHVEGTLAVLEACRSESVPPRVVVVSSAEVYGRPEMDYVREDHPLRPRSPYAAAKVGVEALVAAYVASYGLTAIVLRPFSVYGPGMSPHSLLGGIAGKVLRDEPVVVHDVRPVRDFCFVGDFAASVLRACIAPVSGLVTCNVGTMQGTSVAQLCHLWLDVLGGATAAREDPAKRRPGASEIYRLVSDNAYASQALGWSPAVPLREGLQITARSLRA